MLNAFASLKCLKKCQHNVQKPTCREGDKRFLFLAIPTFDIGSLTALLTIFVSFHGSEKSRLSASEKNHFDIKWWLYNVQFAKQYQKIFILPSQKGLEFSGGWGVL